MRYLIHIHNLYCFLFDRWTCTVEEFPEMGKAVVWKVNKFSGKYHKRCKIKTLK